MWRRQSPASHEGFAAALPSLTIGTDGPILIRLDQHQVHKVSGRDELHDGRGGGGSADALCLSEQRGIQLRLMAAHLLPNPTRLGAHPTCSNTPGSRKWE